MQFDWQSARESLLYIVRTIAASNYLKGQMPPKKKHANVPWEWKDDEGNWNSFASADAAMLEQRWKLILSTNLSIFHGHLFIKMHFV